MFITTSSGIFSIIFIIIGFFLYHWVNKRRFNRRNMAGVEGFKSYEQSVFIRLLEKIGKLLAYIFIILGIFLAIVAYFTKNKDVENDIPTKIEQTETTSSHQ